MTHMTHTGYYAGTPLCGCNKEIAASNGDDFQHIPTRKWIARWEELGHSWCSDCLLIYHTVDDEMDEDLD